MCGEVVTFSYRARYGAHLMNSTERQQRDRRDAAYGDWLRHRLAEQKPDRWTQQRLRDELAQRGYEVKREWLNQVIGGKHASEDLQRAIAALLGEFPEPTASDPTNAELAAAIRQQAAAINELVEELRLGRREQGRWNKGVQRVVEGLAETLEREPPTGPRPPRLPVGAGQ